VTVGGLNGDYCLVLKKVDSKESQKMIRFQSLPRQQRQSIRDEVLRLYAETDLSYGEIAEENGVQVRTVEYIVRNFASELPDVPTMRKKKSDSGTEDYDSLRSEVTRLRQEKMRADALDTMIDVAEEMFNIPVRKKAGTKQLKRLYVQCSSRYTVSKLCGLFGKSKQACYKHDEDVELRRAALEEFAIQYIREVKVKDQSLGDLKIWIMYRREFGDAA